MEQMIIICLLIKNTIADNKYALINVLILLQNKKLSQFKCINYFKNVGNNN